jgi:glycosyltransferase involved in cell wall biosynthesis
LGNAILSILRKPELRNRLTGNAVKTVDEHFKIECIAEKYVDLYKLLLGERRRSYWNVGKSK